MTLLNYAFLFLLGVVTGSSVTLSICLGIHWYRPQPNKQAMNQTLLRMLHDFADTMAHIQVDETFEWSIATRRWSDRSDLDSDDDDDLGGEPYGIPPSHRFSEN